MKAIRAAAYAALLVATFSLPVACSGGLNGSKVSILPAAPLAGSPTWVVPRHLHIIAFTKAHHPIAKSAGQDVYALFKWLETKTQEVWVYGAPAVQGNAAPLSQIGYKESKKSETYLYLDARGRLSEVADARTKALVLVGYNAPTKKIPQSDRGYICFDGKWVETFDEQTRADGTTTLKTTKASGACPKSIKGAVAFFQPQMIPDGTSPSKANVAYYSCLLSGTLFQTAANKLYLASRFAKTAALKADLHASGDAQLTQQAKFAALCNSPGNIGLTAETPPTCPGPKCVYQPPPVPIVPAGAFCPPTKVIDITFNEPSQQCSATLTGPAGGAFTAKSGNTSIVTVSPASGTFDGSGKATLTFVAGLLGGSTAVTTTGASPATVFNVTNLWTSSAPVSIAQILFQLPTSTPPLGQTMTFSIVAKSADGQTISGTYDHPIALSATNFDVSPSSVATSAQAAQITATWKAGFAGSGSGSISASADGQKASATLQPGSGFAFYNVGANPNTDVAGFQMALGPDGNIYYGTQGPAVCSGSFCASTNGAVGQFDPNTGTATEVVLGSPTVGLFFSSDGALWVAGDTSHNLYRFASTASFSSGPTNTIAVPAPSGGSKYMIRNIAQDGNNNIWFTDGRGGRIIEVPLTGPYTSLTAYNLPKGLTTSTPQISPWGGGIVYNAFSNAYQHPGLFVTDFLNGVVDEMDPTNGSMLVQYAGPQQNHAGSSYTVQPRFITLFKTSQIAYTGLGPTNLVSSSSKVPLGFVDAILPAGGPVARQPAMPIAVNPSGTAPDSIASNGSYVYYADLAGGLGFINTAVSGNSTAREFPIEPLSSGAGTSVLSKAPNGVVVMPDGTAWFTCYGYGSSKNLGPLCLGHTVYTSAWSIWPGPSFSIVGYGAANSQPIGIMESPSKNSAPFTTSVDNPSVCSVSQTSAGYYFAYSGSAPDHNFYVTGLAQGTCTVTVTDKSGHNNSVQVTVLPPGALVTNAVRAAQRRRTIR